VAATAAATPPPDAAKPAATAGGPTSAAEFARRAAASAARRDFPAAIADYGRAIELEPENAAHYHARGMARLSNRQPVLAMADLDQALKYDPKDLQALTVRGELYLQAQDPKRAQADFEAAQKLAPANSELSARIGLAYARSGMFDLAIHQLDGWIALHPKDENLAQAVGARCWVRALANNDLEAALADCDSAMRRDRNSVLMTYRGLVFYRMGRLDEALAQYAAAIKAQPRAALALYLRGLAEEKKGDRTDGEADLAAAHAIAPNLPEDYKRFGLAPEQSPASAAKS
jgi:tetratricopeptide (TPR) repeat protein